MELRAKLLRHRRVRDVPDQHVVEAEAVVAVVERAVGPEQLLPRQREEDAAQPVAPVDGRSSATAPRWNSRPSTEARWSTARSPGSRRSMRAARSAWIVAGTVSSCRVGIVGEHGEHLLDEQRVALGRVDDAIAKRRVDRRRRVRSPSISCVGLVVAQRGERDECRSRPRRRP